MQDKKNREMRHKTKKKLADETQDKEKWGDEMRDKKNGEMRRETRNKFDSNNNASNK